LPHQLQEILPQCRVWLPHHIVGLELLHRISIAAARLQQRPRDREGGRKRPPEGDLLPDRGISVQEVEHVPNAVTPQDLSMNTREQLRIAQLDRIAKTPGNSLKKSSSWSAHSSGSGRSLPRIA